VFILNTAQHRELTDDPLGVFGLKPDIDLDLMRPDQELASLTARLIEGLERVFKQERPETILAQGDTTTVLAASLAAFYLHLPFGHVEAGLRTGDLDNPFPEEANRSLAARLTRLHFAPTPRAKQNLVGEGVPEDWIHMTGNPVIDALLWVADKVKDQEADQINNGRRVILVTAHRRESFGSPIRSICRGLKGLVDRFEDVEIVYPVHPNPNVAGPVVEILGGLDRVRLTEPLDYGRMVAFMKRAYLILTDSGGIQEEAPALGVPVLVLRKETERPEAIEAGVARLVGPDQEAIVTEAGRLLSDTRAYRAMASGASPYGDGRAAERIVRILGEFMGVGRT
jgi:UDP-N-acetylglucosamine 2-epimerase (non-hydrolysing)